MSQKRIPLASIIASVILLIDTFSLSLSSLVIDISDATIVLSDGAVIRICLAPFGANKRSNFFLASRNGVG